MATTEKAITHDKRLKTSFERSDIRTKDREGYTVNVGNLERWGSGLGGAALTLYGIKRGGIGGAALALLGGGLIYRCAAGHSFVYDSLGINTSNRKGRAASVRHGEGIKVEKSVTINKSPEELYRFWRRFENLPRFMNHLESVASLGGNRYRWVAKAPAGTTVEWEAEIYNEKENEMIAWRSLEGSQIPNAGSVYFMKAPAGRGTEVRVEVNYAPPGGKLGAMVAKLFGEEPEQQIQEDLRRFKQIMEAGEVSSTEGQPSGRDASAKAVTTGRV